MNVVHIVCLKWGSKYGPEYVNRLYAGIKRHTTKKFKFYCMTEDGRGIHPDVQIVPLAHADRLDSWWNKISLFGNDLPIPIGQKIFYIDLDTLIVGNIDDLLGHEQTEIVVLKDFYHGIAKTAGTVASGLMSWKHRHYKYIWQEFMKNPEDAIKRAAPHGDQWWIEQSLLSYKFWQDLYPGQVVSFKIHCLKGLPANARIVCYHGRPSIPESAHQSTRDWKFKIQPQSWVLDHWRDD